MEHASLRQKLQWEKNEMKKWKEMKLAEQQLKRRSQKEKENWSGTKPRGRQLWGCDDCSLKEEKLSNQKLKLEWTRVEDL